MRLFVAVLPPEAAAAELAAVLRPLQDLPEGRRLRWTGSETWHVTLAFLGDVGEEQLPELERRLGRAAHRHGVHRVRLSGGGRFGGRALWAGVQGDTRALRRLAESVQAAARRTGIAVDDRPYRAHLTLARSGAPRGGDQGKGPGMRGLAEALDGFEGAPWEVAEVQLVRSFLGSGPPRYETLRAWPLADRPTRHDGPPDGPRRPAE